MNDMEDFGVLVMNMRHAQKQYFATRDKKWLIVSKGLESQVDSAIMQMGLVLTQEEI